MLKLKSKKALSLVDSCLGVVFERFFENDTTVGETQPGMARHPRPFESLRKTKVALLS